MNDLYGYIFLTIAYKGHFAQKVNQGPIIELSLLSCDEISYFV